MRLTPRAGFRPRSEFALGRGFFFHQQITAIACCLSRGKWDGTGYFCFFGGLPPARVLRRAAILR